MQFGTVGQQVYHKWSCDSETVSTFCMLVHSCTVDDGKGDRVDILDQNGCAVDRYVLNNIEYPEDLLAGQEAHVYKYADRESLYYQCQISIQVKESGDCVRPKCPDLLSSSPVTIFNKTRQEQVPASVQDGVSLPVNRFRSSMEHYNRESPRRHPRRRTKETVSNLSNLSTDIASRLLQTRRGKRFALDDSLTVDVRAEMTAMEAGDEKYHTSDRVVCMSRQMLLLTMSSVFVIFFSLLSVMLVFLVRFRIVL